MILFKRNISKKGKNMKGITFELDKFTIVNFIIKVTHVT